MNERVEPSFTLGTEPPAQRVREVHVHHYLAYDEKRWWRLAGALALVVLGLLAVLGAVRWYQLQAVRTAIEQVGKTTSAASQQMVERARAQAEEQARRAEAERAAKAAAQRQAHDAELARVAAAQAQAERREKAWQSFYKPSAACRNPDNRATMDCINEHIRAKREFEKRWQAGEL